MEDLQKVEPTFDTHPNWYNTHPNLLHELYDERLIIAPDFTLLTKKHLIQSWFAVIESSGGHAEPNIESVHPIEIALYHIEKALEQLKDYK